MKGFFYGLGVDASMVVGLGVDVFDRLNLFYHTSLYTETKD